MGVEGIGARRRAQGRPALYHRQRPLRRRHQAVGMTYAHFIRSPHAHARSRALTLPTAMSMPGVLAVLTGQQIVDDKVGNLICGWAITSKDGSPMKMGAWPAMAPETVRFVGQAVAVVIAESKKPGTRCRGSRRDRLRGAAGRSDVLSAIKPGAPQLHPEAPGNVVYDWALGDEAAVSAALRQGPPCGHAGPHQQPPGAERDGAARGRSPIMTRPKSTIRCTRPRRIRMSRGWCCRRSTTSRPSTSCAWWRPMSVAALVRRSTSIPRKWWRCGPRKRSAAP